MNRFAVIVYTESGEIVRYCAMAHHVCDIANEAFDRFGICSVCAQPL